MGKKLYQLLLYVYVFFSKILKSSYSSPQVCGAGKVATIKIIFIFRILYIFHLLFFFLIFVFVFRSSSSFFPAFLSCVFLYVSFPLCLLFASIEICQSIKDYYYVVSLNLNVNHISRYGRGID